jgi:hypothetical protein
MVFSAHVIERTRADRRAYGVNAGEATPGGEQTLSTFGTANRVDVEARIKVNILAATDDGGLVAEISEEGRDRNSPSTRIGITKDGQVLQMDRSASLFDEENGLLMMLARNFANGHDNSNGSSWTLPLGPNANGLNVKVTADAGSHVSLSLHGEAETSDGGVRQQVEGSITYDVTRTTPVSGTLTTATETIAAGGTSTDNITVEYALESDTLAGK